MRAGIAGAGEENQEGPTDTTAQVLTPMRSFSGDHLDPARTHGELSLRLCADNRDTVLHALRDIARHTRGGACATRPTSWAEAC